MKRNEQNQRNIATACREYAAGRLSRRQFLSWTACWGAAGLAATHFPTPAAAAGTVRYYTWGGYQDTKIFAEFEKRHGASVNGIAMNSNEEAFVKIRQVGGKGYDVFTADAWWPRQHEADKTIQPLKLSKFSTAKTLYPSFKKLSTVYVNDDEVLGIPYHWEYQTVCYRADKIDAAPKSLSVVFDEPKYAGRVVWRDRGTETIALMAMLRGIPLERKEHPRQWHLEPAELEKVKNELIAAKKRMNPLWYRSNTEAIKMFSSNEIDLGYCSSYVVYEIARVGGPKTLPVKKIPANEKFPGYVDAMCLVKGAENAEAGEKLIEFLTSFEGRKMFFEKSGYAATDKALMDWALGAGYKPQLETRGTTDPDDIVPHITMLAPPTNLEAWAEAFNQVKAA